MCKWLKIYLKSSQFLSQNSSGSVRERESSSLISRSNECSHSNRHSTRHPSTEVLWVWLRAYVLGCEHAHNYCNKMASFTDLATECTEIVSSDYFKLWKRPLCHRPALWKCFSHQQINYMLTCCSCLHNYIRMYMQWHACLLFIACNYVDNKYLMLACCYQKPGLWQYRRSGFNCVI